MGEIALGGLEKEDKELHQLDFAVFSKVNPYITPLPSPSGVLLSTAAHQKTLLVLMLSGPHPPGFDVLCTQTDAYTHTTLWPLPHLSYAYWQMHTHSPTLHSVAFKLLP